MTDVGHEIPPYFLESTPLAHVLDQRHCPHEPVAVEQWRGGDHQNPAWGPEQLQGALAATTGNRLVEKLDQRRLHQGLAVTGSVVLLGRTVAEHHLTGLVGHQHPAGHGVERTGKPVTHLDHGALAPGGH